MKKLMMLVAGAVALGFAAHADEETFYEGVEYVLNEGNRTAKVVKNHYATDNFVIPEKVYDFGGEEYTVTAIGQMAFYSSFLTVVRTI